MPAIHSLGVKKQFKASRYETITQTHGLQSQANWLAAIIFLITKPVIWSLLAALPSTVLSMLPSGMPDAAPAIDSDFSAGLGVVHGVGLYRAALCDHLDFVAAPPA